MGDISSLFGSYFRSYFCATGGTNAVFAGISKRLFYMSKMPSSPLFVPALAIFYMGSSPPLAIPLTLAVRGAFIFFGHILGHTFAISSEKCPVTSPAYCAVSSVISR